MPSSLSHRLVLSVVSGGYSLLQRASFLCMLVAEQGFQGVWANRNHTFRFLRAQFNSCYTALRDLPIRGMEPLPPALASRFFFTIEPPVVPSPKPPSLKDSSPISIFLPALLPGYTEVLTIPYTNLGVSNTRPWRQQFPPLSLLHSFIP